jgi:hypothetical protein
MGLFTGTACVYLVNVKLIDYQQREILLEARRALLRTGNEPELDPRVMRQSTGNMSIAESLNFSLISLSDRFIFQNKRAPG